MFDIGFSEIFLVAVVALLVLGPERLPKAARFAGLWVRRARAQWYSVKAELENELADEELQRALRQTQADLREARDALAQSGAALQREFEEAGANVTGTPRDLGPEDAPMASAAELEEPPVPMEQAGETAAEEASDPVRPAGKPEPEPEPEHAPDARR